MCSFIFVFCIVFQVFFSYASSFCMTHDIHIFNLYGVDHLSYKCFIWVLFKLPLRFALLASFCNHVIDIKILSVFFCCNPSLELVTKTKGCKVAGQVGNLGVTSHVPGNAKSVRESTFTLPSELPCWELESQMDFQNFKEQFQGSKFNGLWRSLYRWKYFGT